MIKLDSLKLGLALGAAPIALVATPAQAGGLSSLLSGLTKPVSTKTGTVTKTVGQTTTVVVSVVPLSTKTTDTLSKITNPLLVTVNGTPGSVTNTTTATTSIVDNTLQSGLPYLLPDTAFAAPPSAGDIEPKWGKIRSFWGKIRSFEGEEVSPFWGKIRTFWGDVGPFEGNSALFWGDLQTYNSGAGSANSVTPEWGKIRSFWDELGTSWGSTRTVWDAGDYAATSARLGGMVDRSALFWGDAVQAETGKNFRAGFADALLARYGIELDDPSSLAKLDVNEREHFFLEWYDGLMQFSGADHPDYWMRMVNWTPKLTQNAGEGKDSVIGLLDFTVSNPDGSRIKTYDGASNVDNGHGAAVASLMVGAHDGKGVMGLAPMAKVVAYNPFDATQTAGWADIKDGILTLGQHGASIINMSLGVPGWTLHPDWNSVLADPAVALSTSSTVFVIAAGNEGITQPQDIKWTNSANFIVVGSVDPSSAISEFSNRPGETCLTNGGSCDKLKNHFIVAPGEMMLVADGQGGVTRYSGTSFAAPLVSGTAALIHDRWPWLAKYPVETVKIILDSATDLGAPGVDGVYGVGMLDVTGALSPIDYGKLTWYGMDDQGRAKPMSSAAVRSASAGQLASWDAAGMYFHAFETVGGTYRDFAIPLSGKLVDSQVLSAGGSKEQFQAYLYNQMLDWMKTGASFTDASPTGRASLNYTANSANVPTGHGLKLTMSLAPRTVKGGDERRSFNPVQTSLRLASENERFAVKLGDGDGAVELGNASGFTRASDYDRATGGANPLLGMASGGTYAQASYAVARKLSLSVGFTEQDTRYSRSGRSISEAGDFGTLRGYRTSASNVGVTWRPSERLELNGSYTRLREGDAILGVQSLSSDLLGRGATTQGVTLAASYQLTPTLQISGSATMGRTASASADALVAAGGLRSSAYQFAVAKQGLFAADDALRFSVSQPLHVDGGKLDVSSVQVIDRQTGELGLVTERFDLPGSKRPLVGEFQYARALMDGQADLALFGKAQLRGDAPVDRSARMMAGARLRLRY